MVSWDFTSCSKKKKKGSIASLFACMCMLYISEQDGWSKPEQLYHAVGRKFLEQIYIKPTTLVYGSWNSFSEKIQWELNPHLHNSGGMLYQLSY